MKLLLGGARRAISPCSTEQIHSKSVLLELAIQHLGPPTESYDWFSLHTLATRKNVQIDVGDLDLRDSRLWAHNLSARMGLEVRGAMNPSRRTASQANDDPNIDTRTISESACMYCGTVPG